MFPYTYYKLNLYNNSNFIIMKLISEILIFDDTEIKSNSPLM